VSVDAVTGKLIRSETTFMFAAAGSR
jgi:hypothetical protein